MLDEQVIPKEYDVKWDVDMQDPVNICREPPKINAKAFMVWDVDTNMFVYSKNCDKKLEIASMTKIMTFYTCLKVLYNDLTLVNINPKKTFMRTSKKAANMIGTSARVKEGLHYSMYDLFVGLMLPSGNDASIVLAENFGRYLLCDNLRYDMQSKLKKLLRKDPYDIDQSNQFV
jgi:D-alanyl-D-alanine carboxypeptidase